MRVAVRSFGDRHGTRDRRTGRRCAERRVGQARSRNAEADQIERDDGRQAAEDIAIEDGERADRLAGGARHQPRQRHDQPPDQHQDFGDDKDEDVVDENCLMTSHHFSLHQRQQEERLPDGGIVHEHEADEAEGDQGEDAPAEGRASRSRAPPRCRCGLRRCHSRQRAAWRAAQDFSARSAGQNRQAVAAIDQPEQRFPSHADRRRDCAARRAPERSCRRPPAHTGRQTAAPRGQDHRRVWGM